MPSQIRPNRLEVSDRFPMLGFTIRSDGKRYEVALASDATLFQPEARAKRDRTNFYSSRAAGPQAVDRGEAVYVLPPEVLVRFVGRDKLYFALATYANGSTSNPEISVMPSASSPYINLKALSARSLKRIQLLPSRQRAASRYGNGSVTDLDWAGDAAMPGTQPTVAPVPVESKPNGKGGAATPAPPLAAETAALAYSDGFGALPVPGPTPAVTRRPARARAQSNESFSINWDEVELVPQPNEFTCWATAASMVIGWRDRVSLTPETVADICGRSKASGLQLDDCRQFAGELGLEFEEPQSYAIDGLRALLESGGPLWVTVKLPGSGHAIVVTGMYSDGAPDGADTFVRISDPWDRVVGVPGAPGAYLSTHSTGSRYILSWADFVSEYERLASSAGDGTVNAQILHAAGVAGRQPSRSGAVGYAMATAPSYGSVTAGGAPRGSIARPLVFDRDDLEAAQKDAPAWKDLLTFSVADSVVSGIEARDMRLQRYADAIGDLNLDYYPVMVDRLPDGFDTPADLLRHIRLNVNDFVETTNSEFVPYSPGNDDVTWASESPVGTVLKINIVGGVVHAAVVVSLAEESKWRFSTVTTPDTGAHPVTGHRDFGYWTTDSGGFLFYTRAADRSTGALETMGGVFTFDGADRLWKSFQTRLAAFVNDSARGGSAKVQPRVSNRYKWSLVDILVVHPGAGQSLGVPQYGAERLARPAAAMGLALAARVPVEQARPVTFPPAREATMAERFAIDAIAAGMSALAGPLGTVFPILRAAATSQGASVAIGPTGGAGFGLGIGVGVGVIFAPNDRIGVYGQLSDRVGFIDSLTAGVQLTIVRGGIEAFNEIGFAVTGAFVEGIDVTLQILLGADRLFRGLSFELGAGIAAEPFEVFRAVEAPLSAAIGTPVPAAGSALSYAKSDRPLPLAPAPVVGARALEAGVLTVASAIAGAVMERVVNHDGKITWQLEQLRGMKHPKDVAPNPAPAFRDATTIRLDEWPYVEALTSDRISAWFSVDWQFNGQSVGNVQISNIGTNGALLRGLTVDAKIMDDNIVYQRGGSVCAALKIRFDYQFTRLVGSDSIAITDLHLYGDGTFDQSSRWEQS